MEEKDLRHVLFLTLGFLIYSSIRACERYKANSPLSIEKLESEMKRLPKKFPPKNDWEEFIKKNPPSPEPAPERPEPP